MAEAMTQNRVKSEEVSDIEFMSAQAFRKWRKSLHLKQKEAADALGLKKRIIQYYEKGHRDGKSVIIPRTVRLACYAISQGIADFSGDRTVPADRKRS